MEYVKILDLNFIVFILNLILLVIEIVLAAHFVQYPTPLTSPNIRLRIKIRQHNTLPILSLLLRQSQVKGTLGLFLPLAICASGALLSKHGMVRYQTRLAQCSYPSGGWQRWCEDEFFRYGSSAAPSNLHFENESSHVVCFALGHEA